MIAAMVLSASALLALGYSQAQERQLQKKANAEGKPSYHVRPERSGGGI